MAILPEGLNFGGIGGGIGSALQTFTYIIGGIIILIVVGSVVGIFVWKRREKKAFNIPLIIITPRSDGRVVEINRGLGGYFKSRREGGIVSFRIKRKGIKTCEIPPPSSDYLMSPDRTLMLAQKGVDDYEPIMPARLSKVETLKGDIVPILKLKAKNQDATAWAFDNAETAKRRFTLSSLWDKYQGLITMMIFIFVLFLILYIQWIGMKDVVTGLADVADSLRGTTQPIIAPS